MVEADLASELRGFLQKPIIVVLEDFVEVPGVLSGYDHRMRLTVFSYAVHNLVVIARWSALKTARNHV